MSDGQCVRNSSLALQFRLRLLRWMSAPVAGGGCGVGAGPAAGSVGAPESAVETARDREPGARLFAARNFVGTVGVDSHAIYILPKVDQDDAATRANLMRMLAIAGLVPSLGAGVTDLAASAPTLVDAFMQVYLHRLAVEWRRGHIASYRQDDANRPCLRGKLLFTEQMRLNRLHPERFCTRADQFLQDVPLSRLLKAGLHVCRRPATSATLQRGAAELLGRVGERAVAGDIGGVCRGGGWRVLMGIVH